MNTLVYSDNSFSKIENWSFVLPLIILLGALLVGNMLRKIPFIKKSLIPASLMGGAIILIISFIPAVKDFLTEWGMVYYKSASGYDPSYESAVSIFESITFHSLALGFIAMSLKNKKKNNLSSTGTVISTGALTANTYILQAIVGIGVGLCTMALPAAGIILCLGFGQGPAQAMNWSKEYSAYEAFHGNSSFGLSIACIGFIVASVVGVIYLNILRRKGKLTLREEKIESEVSDFESEDEIPKTESVDRFSIQLALVLALYGLTYLLLLGLDSLGIKLIYNLAWGFNFLFGVIIASLFKLVYSKLRKKGVIKREYINNYLLDRIAGFMFDLMIVAGTASIVISDIKDYVLPIVIMCTIGTIVTFVYVRIVCNYLYKGYENEAFFAMFGMLTGTASNGIILLREIDPNFETPAANNLVLQNFPAIIFGAPILLLCGFAPESRNNTIVTLLIICVLFALFNIFIFREIFFKKTYEKKHKLKENKEEVDDDGSVQKETD